MVTAIVDKVLRAKWTVSGLTVVDDELGPLSDGWVRLRVQACGICGTDLHSWRDADRRRLGSTPGHELVGTVSEGPAGLADVLYAVNPNVNCGVCEFCIVGEPQLCRRGGYGIGMGRDGGLAELVDVPLANAYAVDQEVGVLEASLAEPLAVAVHAASLARPDLNSRVLIVGGGTVGLLMAVVLRDVARDVAVTTRYAHQKEAATAIGVRGLDEGDAEAWGKANRPDVVIETVGGDGSTLRAAMRAARRGARVVVVGAFGTIEVDMGLAMLKELAILPSSIYGTDRRGQQFGGAVELLPRWQRDLKPLLTHQFSLGDVEGAFRCSAEKSTGALKVTITP
jgi:threonine dehydrogenase-like Zn-dependent dehydrogenase